MNALGRLLARYSGGGQYEREMARNAVFAGELAAAGLSSADAVRAAPTAHYVWNLSCYDNDRDGYRKFVMARALGAPVSSEDMFALLCRAPHFYEMLVAYKTEDGSVEGRDVIEALLDYDK